MPLTAAQQTDAYRFFAIAFGAAPGVTYMNQIADAYAGGATTKQIVNAFVSKDQFTSIYPTFLSNQDFATKLVANVVGSYATAAAQTQAVADIVAALNGGSSRGDVIYTIFNNLAAKPATDATWGSVSTLLANQVATSKYYTETLLGNTTDVTTLKTVVSKVTPTTDTSASALATLLKDVPLAAVTGPTISAAAASVNEGGSAVFNIVGSPNTDYAVVLGGTATAGADYTASSSLVTVTTDVNGKATLSLATIKDHLTEGTETITASVVGGSGLATISVADTSLTNVAPVITSSTSLTGTEDTATKFTVTATDANVEDTVAYSVGAVTGGTATIDSASGAVTFTPTANFNGNATVVVTASDGTLSSSKTVTIAVAAVNDAPTVSAATQAVAATEDTAVSFTVSASDVDTGDTLTYSAGAAANGKVVAGSTAGTFTYTPNANFNGTDSVVITVTDKAGATATQTVNFTVAAVNDAPAFAATTATVSVAENSTAVGTYAATDVDTGDTLTYSLTGDDAALFSVSSAGVVSFKTAPNYEVPGSSKGTNAYSVTVVATDAAGAAASQALTVNVTDVSDAPSVKADAVSTETGRATSINVLAGTYVDRAGATQSTGGADSAVAPGGVLSLVSVTAPNNGGSASISGGTISYTSSVGYTGTETFNYVVSDGKGGTSTGSVTVTVSANLGATSGDDVIYGSRSAEYIDGGAGNDTIIGGGGLDTISGGDGNDRVTFSDAADIINGGAGVDTLVVNSDALNSSFDFSSTSNQITDSASKNSLNRAATVRNFENLDATNAGGSVTVTGLAVTTTSVITGSSDDTITLSGSNGASSVSLSTNGGNDSINVTGVASTVAFVIDAGDGNDTVLGGSGADSIFGGAGNDSLSGGVGNDTILGGDGNDSIDGGVGNNSLSGGDGNDTIIGGTSADTIDGGNGNDSITGGSGADVLQGGAGNDTFVFASFAEWTSAATVSGGADTDTVSFNTALSSITVADSDFSTARHSFEVFSATTGADIISVATNAVAIGLLRVNAGGGDDQITLGATVSAFSVDGGAGSDTLIYNATGGITVALTVYDVETVTYSGGGTSNDTLTIARGTGAYSLSSVDLGAGTADSVIITNTSGGSISSILGAESVTGGSGVDRLTIGSQAAGVYIDGGDGADTITGGSGADTIMGGTGTGADYLDGGAGTGADYIDGGDGADTLVGGSGADTLIGGDGADSLYGGDGADSLNGGLGNDTFYFATVAEMTGDAAIVGGGGTDTIKFDPAATHTVTDANFANVSAVSTLTLGDTGNDQVTLGTGAVAAGIVTVNLGSGNDTLTVSDGVAFTVNGGAGTDYVVLGSGGATITAINVESITTGGGTFTANDTITFAASHTADVSAISTGPGNDSVTFGSTGAAAINVTQMDLGTGTADTVVITSTAGIVISSILGAESVTGGSGVDRLTIGSQAAGVYIDGGDGADTITGGSGADTIMGGTGTGADYLDGGAGTGADYIDGGDGADTLVGGSGADTLIGGDGADSLYGGDGADSLNGGLGNDTFYFATVAEMTGDAAIVGGGGTDTIKFDPAATHTVTDANFANVSAVSTLTLGDTGNDQVTLGTGAVAAGIVTVNLGSGNDTLTVSDGVAFTVNGGAGTDYVVLGSGGATITAINVESITTGGGTFTANDTITFAASHTADVSAISTGPGNDSVTFGSTGAAAINVTGTIDMGTGTGDSITINSTAGITIAQIQGAETITGGSGADNLTSVVAQTGGTYIDAGAGNDSIGVTGAGTITIVGGAGTDTVTIQASTVTLSVSQVEIVNGSSGSDAVTFTAATTSGTYATGVETITLSSSDDVFEMRLIQASGATTSASIAGGLGNDTITLTLAENGTSLTGAVVVTVNGGLGNDTITISDAIVNTSGEIDTVYIVGGAGADTIQLGGHTGAGSIDVVRWNLSNDLASGVTLSNADQVTGFGAGTGSDYIDLTGITLVNGANNALALNDTTGANAGSTRDDFSGGRTLSGAAATFADLSAGSANQGAYVIFVTDGGTGSFTASGAIDRAVTLITGSMGTSGVTNGQKVVIVVQSTSGNSNALFLYQESTGGTGISSTELTLIGVVDGKTLVAGDFQ